MPSITPKKVILIEENGQLYEEGIELKDARFGKVHRLYRLQRIEVEGRNEEIYVRTEEKLAVKKFHKRAILYNREKAENPLHEFAALQLLLNPAPDYNNIPYIDCFADNEIIYLVTPYYSSGDLLDLIFQKQSFGQTFTITEMKEMFTQLTAQLHSIHNLGIVHRDLSLENILYDKESKRYTIIDYGMSMWLNEDVATTTEPQNIFIDDMDAMAASNEEKESSCMIISAPSSPAYSSSSSAMTSFASPSTSSSYSSSMYDRFARVSKYIVCGKQHYMAPEIWANETDLQLMYSDVWSLGVIFFMVLMFQAPFASSKRSDPNFHFYLHNGQCLEELILQLNNDLPIFASKPVEEHKAYEQLIDLMGHMLRPNLHERYTIEDVMNHPFFQN